jgi:hypothetical protein
MIANEFVQIVSKNDQRLFIQKRIRKQEKTILVYALKRQKMTFILLRVQV